MGSIAFTTIKSESTDERAVSFDVMVPCVDEITILKDGVNGVYEIYRNDMFYTDGDFYVKSHEALTSFIAIQNATFLLITTVNTGSSDCKLRFKLKVVQNISAESWDKIHARIEYFKEAYNANN